MTTLKVRASITTDPVAPLHLDSAGKNRANFLSDISQSMSTPLSGICATEPTALVTNQTFLLVSWLCEERASQ